MQDKTKIDAHCLFHPLKLSDTKLILLAVCVHEVNHLLVKVLQLTLS